MESFDVIGALFDLDGVIIDSEREYSRIWRTINREYPTGIDNLEYLIKGCTLDKILQEYYPEMEMREKVISRLYELEGKMNYQYLPGAKELLDNLSLLKIPKVLVTSSNDDKMKHLYEEIPDITDQFSFIVTANQITKSKPDPEGYLLGANKIKKNIRKCIVFEDSLQGVMAGHNAGAFVVGVAGTLPADVIAPFSNIVVDNLSKLDLKDLLLEVAKRDE